MHEQINNIIKKAKLNGIHGAELMQLTDSQGSSKKPAESNTTPKIITWNGFRIVEPYGHCYETFVKGRWLGKKLLEIFQSEFRDRSSLYYLNAIRAGKIQLNNRVLKEGELQTVLLKQNDKIQHQVHRHEPLVPDHALKVVQIDRERGLLVLDKPGGWPCHPTGRYYYNSTNEICRNQLEETLKIYQDKVVKTEVKLLSDYSTEELALLDEITLSKLRSAEKKHVREQERLSKKKDNIYLANIHRLDRLTSGVLLVGFNRDKSVVLHDQMAKRLFGKTYIAKVKGKFPGNSCSIMPDNNGSSVLICKEPLYVVDHKSSLCSVAPRFFKVMSETSQDLWEEEGFSPYIGQLSTFGYCRSAETHFSLMNYHPEENTSLIYCEPKTGRTHQIRVHLQYLGYPIIGDPLYNNVLWEGMERDEEHRFQYKDLIELSRKYMEDMLPESRSVMLEKCGEYFKDGHSELVKLDTALYDEDRVNLEDDINFELVKGFPRELLNLPKWFDNDCDECQRQWIRSFQSYIKSKRPLIRPINATKISVLDQLIQMTSLDSSLTAIDCYIPLIVTLDTSYQLRGGPMCLHALKYTSLETEDPWSFKTEYPDWASR